MGVFHTSTKSVLEFLPVLLRRERWQSPQVARLSPTDSAEDPIFSNPTHRSVLREIRKAKWRSPIRVFADVGVDDLGRRGCHNVSIIQLFPVAGFSRAWGQGHLLRCQGRFVSKPEKRVPAEAAEL